jgi:hypothetical protein
MATKIDFAMVTDVLTEVVREMEALDNFEWDDDGTNNSEKAEVSRRLNHLSDALFLASALVRNEYWTGKGFTDVVREGDTP